MAKVVLATGVEQLDREIAGELAENDVEVASICYYLEGVLPCCIQKQADTVVISPELPGTTSLQEVIITLRRSPLDVRVILLPGPEDLDDPGELAGSVIGAGVYDIVFSTPSSAGSTVNAKEVTRRVLTPATYAEAEALLTSGAKMHPSIMQEREPGHISDAPGIAVNEDEEAAIQSGAKEVVKKTLNLGLPKFMQGMIARISNSPKSNEQELLGNRESGWEPPWETEGWDPPLEEPEQNEQNSSPEAWKIPTPDEEAINVLPAENSQADLVLSASAEKDVEKIIWEDPVHKTVEEDHLNWVAEEEQTPAENLIESLGGWEEPGESVPENYCQNRAPEYQPGSPAVRRKQNTKIGLAFQGRKVAPERGNLGYLPHQLVAVWSPDGWAKSYTAFNLAALAVNMGFDTALINYDLHCPELDTWFGVKQTGIGDFEENSAGVTTFGDCCKPELVSHFLKKRAWGIRYLPAGNKLGNICTPDFDLEALEQTLKIVYQRNTGGKPAITVVDAGRSFKHASTMATLRQAAIVLIPTDGSPVIAEVTKQQIEELNRLGHNPRFIEVLFTTPGRKVVHICQERCSVAFDWNTFLIDRTAMKPQCLQVKGRRAWECVLNQLAPIGADSIFRWF